MFKAGKLNAIARSALGNVVKTEPKDALYRKALGKLISTKIGGMIFKSDQFVFVSFSGRTYVFIFILVSDLCNMMNQYKTVLI